MRADSACLSKLLLREWEKRVILYQPDEGRHAVPAEFGSADGTFKDAISMYRKFWTEFIVEEASASALKQAENAFRCSQVIPVAVTVRDKRFARVTWRYDKRCVCPLVEAGNHVFLVNVRSLGVLERCHNSFKDLCYGHNEPIGSNRVIVFPGCVRSCDSGARNGDRVFEVDCAGVRSCIDRPLWYLVGCSTPITYQRELDALDAMCKSADMRLLVTPSKILGGQEREARRSWPHQIGAKEFVDKAINARHDISQIQAVEACASLFTAPGNVPEPVSKAESASTEPSLLPIVLIQGPPGTGKTHTLMTILNSWLVYQFESLYHSRYQQLKACTGKRRQPGTPSVTLAKGHGLRPRVLVCAHSNVAIDEILGRLMELGFVDSTGEKFSPRIVRIGSESATLTMSAHMVCVDTKVKEMLHHGDAQKQFVARERKEALLAVADYQRQLAAVQSSLASARTRDDSERALRECILKEEDLKWAKHKLDIMQIAQEFFGASTRAERLMVEHRLEQSYMNDAEIVFTTLSSTRRRVFDPIPAFDLVLVDEAAQASEVAILQALTRTANSLTRSGRLVLVGDPMQLPPTLLSEQNKNLGFERSLFERLMDLGWPVQMLRFQYRMHPHISRFPRRQFYDNMLQDSDSTLRRPSLKFHARDLLKPYVVFDVARGHEQGAASKWNLQEINMALGLFQLLRSCIPDGWNETCSVGVLTPYKVQNSKMKTAFEETMGRVVADQVKFCTVDGCQGQEFDVVILSCVRAKRGTRIGFVGDERRMNVGLTRARHALWVLADVDTLSRGSDAWQNLLDEARAPSRNHTINEADAATLFPDARLWS